MAKNDTVLLDGIIDDRVKMCIPSERRDEAFEFLVFEQILSNYDLSKEEIEAGWVDGKDDGGIDGFYIFINGILLLDTENFHWPKKNAELRVYIITCKHKDSFNQAPLDSLVASVSELFDFTIDDNLLNGAYSGEILELRKILLIAYRNLSACLTDISVKYIYASRGDSSDIGLNIKARSEQIIAKTESLFSSCKASFNFIGASDLITLYRKVKNFSPELPFIEGFSQGVSNILVVNLTTYYKFITDESGNLKRYLFEANVRDFLGANRVNEDIAATLSENNSTDFWWLNNGITILSTSSRMIGKVLHLEDVQIVNGLQTSHSIFNYFSNGGTDDQERSVLVKIIALENPNVRDKIIRATNNQSLVELASLHATDTIQRDIDDILERSGWFYERRKNYYRNIGKPETNIITPLYVAGGVIALLLKNPAKASRLKSKFMSDEESYTQVFNSSVPLKVWPKIVSVLKQVESIIEKLRPEELRQGERYLSSWRNLAAFLLLSKKFGKFSYSANELVSADLDSIQSADILEVWDLIDSERKLPGNKNKHQDFNFVLKCCETLAIKYNLQDVKTVGKIHFNKLGKKKGVTRKFKNVVVSDDFAIEVFSLLPKQPWKPRVHLEISAKLSCPPINVSSAIALLIEQGKCFRQIDGVVFDANDNIIAVDRERQLTDDE